MRVLIDPTWTPTDQQHAQDTLMRECTPISVANANAEGLTRHCVLLTNGWYCHLGEGVRWPEHGTRGIMRTANGWRGVYKGNVVTFTGAGSKAGAIHYAGTNAVLS